MGGKGGGGKGEGEEGRGGKGEGGREAYMQVILASEVLSAFITSNCSYKT